jgi:hypothetical protein
MRIPLAPRPPRVTVATLLLSVLSTPGVARAETAEPRFDIGIAPHLALPLGTTCARASDVVECSSASPFAGAQLSAHSWLLDFLALGVGLALSKDLDATEGTGGPGVSWDPEDQWLWRLTVELRLDPPVLPDGVWAGVNAGLALLHETQQFLDEASIGEDSANRPAPLLGLAIGWDIWLDEALTLTPELRAQVIAFGAPPELRADVEGRDYGTSAWLELALRLGFVI